MIPPPSFSGSIFSQLNSVEAMHAPRPAGRPFGTAGTVAAMAVMFFFAAASFGQGPGNPPAGNYGSPASPPNAYANVYVPPPASPTPASSSTYSLPAYSPSAASPNYNPGYVAPAPSPNYNPGYVVPAASPQAYAVPAATDSQPSGWIMGAGVYYFQPRWATNPAYATSVLSSDGGQEAQQDFSSKGGFAPLLWLGYVADNGLGVRGRWWQFSARSSVSADNPPQTDPDRDDDDLFGLSHGRRLCGGQQPGR